ncbi:MAG: hypothetical protein WAR79_11470 [Melioribacteraceae bacterium]
MRNNTCKVCFKEFEPRAGKLYCSNACKQKAFSDNKQQSELREEKAEETTLIKKQLEFNFKEYQEYIIKYPESIENFQLYCFFRKNLTGNPSIEEINNYINSFSKNWWMNFWHEENNPVYKKFKEFEAKFFSDDVSVYFPSRSSQNKSDN